MPIELVIAAVCALAISLALNRAMLVVAPKLGLMDQPGQRRIHSTPIPRAGGIAIWLSFLLPIAESIESNMFAQDFQHVPRTSCGAGVHAASPAALPSRFGWSVWC